MDNKKKTKIILIIGSIILVCLALFTTTYSFFYNEQVAAKPEDYSTGLLSIEARSKSNVISLDDVIPMSDADGANIDPYIFTIKNNGNVDYNFNIKLLATSTSNNIEAQYIKVKVDNNAPVTLSSLTNSIIKSNITLGAKESLDITLRIWLDTNTPNTQIGKSFTSKIVTEGQAVYTETNYDAYDTLPDGYQRVEYIESNGTQYIDTGITMEKTDDIKIEYDYQFKSSTDGLWSGANGYLQLQYSYVGTTDRVKIKVEYTQNTEKVYVNNVNTYTHDWQSYDNINIKIGIFKLGNGGNLWHSSGAQSAKLYSYKLSKNGTLIKNFVPCYRESDSEVGLYDTISRTFQENAGTGDFSSGPEV